MRHFLSRCLRLFTAPIPKVDRSFSMRCAGLHSDFIEKIPRPSREVIFEIIRGSELARAKNAKPEDFIDDQIVRDLEREGYSLARPNDFYPNWCAEPLITHVEKVIERGAQGKGENQF